MKGGQFLRTKDQRNNIIYIIFNLHKANAPDSSEGYWPEALKIGLLTARNKESSFILTKSIIM